MPKTLEVFKKEYDAIKKEFDACDEQTDNSGHVRGHHDAMIEQGARVIGDRVRELRQAGKHGATVDDFKTNSEVKQALAEIDLASEGHRPGIGAHASAQRQLLAQNPDALHHPGEGPGRRDRGPQETAEHQGGFGQQVAARHGEAAAGFEEPHRHVQAIQVDARLHHDHPGL